MRARLSAFGCALAAALVCGGGFLASAQDPEEPRPDPETEPVPSPEPAEAEPPAPTARPPALRPPEARGSFLELLRDYVASPDPVKVRAALEAALQASESDSELRPFAQAAATILGRSQQLMQFIRSSERPPFARILEEHDPVGADLERLQAALADISAAKSELGVIRLWGWAVLARMAVLGLSEAETTRWAGRLGLIVRGGGASRAVGTREGHEMRSLDAAAARGAVDREIRSARLIKDDDFQAFVALLQLSVWDLERDHAKKREHMPELEKHFRTVKVPPAFSEVFRHIADSLRRGAPCTTCSGTGTVSCRACDGGRVVGRCPDCNGTGERRERRRGIVRCDRCEGTGQIARDRCRDCRGQGTSGCTHCGGTPWAPPAMQEFLGQADCGLCDKRGFILSPLWVPCQACLGRGRVPFKP